jgi:hypothetical protein
VNRELKGEMEVKSDIGRNSGNRNYRKEDVLSGVCKRVLDEQ